MIELSAQQGLIAALGLSDSNTGVLLGWALATATAAGTALAEWRQYRAAHASQKATARLLLEELRVAARAAAGDDAGLLAAAAPLPTELWIQRREGLVGTDEWALIASAYVAIDHLNARRTAHLTWRTDDTQITLNKAYEDAAAPLDPLRPPYRSSRSDGSPGASPITRHRTVAASTHTDRFGRHRLARSPQQTASGRRRHVHDANGHGPSRQLHAT